MSEKLLTAQQIRQQFLRFYAERDHQFVPSSPVVPLADPTLMFTNSGMAQFKEVFLGTAAPSCQRAVNSQKCIRAGGKHNDLDDVGHDTYHHTFFEMLGTWSFADYFKRESIRWGWEALTELFKIPKERLHVTYFAGDSEDGLGPDLEARDLWLSVTDIDPTHVHPFGRKDNFWEMAEIGPCGPSSEIHVDLTPDLSGAGLVNADDPRVFEVWNHVFIQFSRDHLGKLSPLAAQYVDTGMGLERLVTVLQHQDDNYKTDLFQPLLAALAALTGLPPYAGTQPKAQLNETAQRDIAYRIVADHLRTLTFAITDGALPDNEGRGYVLRRILRRAYRYGRQYLGMDEPFIHRLVPTVVATMGEAFPELLPAEKKVVAVIRDEETAFARTLDAGLKLFMAAADSSAADSATRDSATRDSATRDSAGTGKISGEIAFKLHDTYGFPIDLTMILAHERGLTVDLEGYQQRMEEARARARGEGRGTLDEVAQLLHATANSDAHFFAKTATDDSAKWHQTELTTSLLGWVDLRGDLRGTSLVDDQVCAILLEATCFYAEQGGQVGDTGWLRTPSGEFAVQETRRLQDTVLHIGRLTRGHLSRGQSVEAEVAADRRARIASHHTATHLLNWALRETLGEVQQKGSLVDASKTRFDFNHGAGLSEAELAQIEAQVNAAVGRDLPVESFEVGLQQALAIRGIRAVFGEKYPEEVRVVAIGVAGEDLLTRPGEAAWDAFSIELCGGTHVARTGELGAFVLIAEEGVAKGIRRVVGVSGELAQQAVEGGERLAATVARLAALPAEQLAPSLPGLSAELTSTTMPLVLRRQLERQLGELQRAVKRHQDEHLRQASQDQRSQLADLLAAAARENHTAMVVGDLPGATPEQLRSAFDWLRDRESSVAVLLFGTAEGKVAFLAGLSPDLVGRGLDANQLLRAVAPLIAGGGGGRPDLAQGGGRKPEQVPAAADHARAWLRDRLA